MMRVLPPLSAALVNSTSDPCLFYSLTGNANYTCTCIHVLSLKIIHQAIRYKLLFPELLFYMTIYGIQFVHCQQLQD